MVPTADSTLPRWRRPHVLVMGVVGAIAAVLLVYSQTLAFAYDEGFHLLAAQLIKSGRRPYLDFMFAQTPLNAYWNAGWMRVFGESWRTAHAVAAVLTTGAVLLTAQFVLSRFPVPRWRTPLALMVAFSVGLNILVFEFGTISQAYGICIFLTVAAFRAGIRAVEVRSVFPAALAGFFGAAAAGCSLLTAPVAPVLALWILFQNRAGSKALKLIALVAGSAVALLPVAWLFLQNPSVVFFDIIQFHLFHRTDQWEGALRQNLEVLTAWALSPQSLALALLATAGVLFVARRSEWERQRRAEFYLCGWLAIVLAIHISRAEPTFERYYLLTVPFLSILAAAGLYSVGSRLAAPDKPFWPVLISMLLVSFPLARRIYEEREDPGWRSYEDLSRKVDQVTAPGVPLLAEEHIYFLTKRRPPSGMEYGDSHKLVLTPGRAAELHVVPRSELNARIKRGEFATLETCDVDSRLEGLDLPKLYRHKETIAECNIFWERAAAPAPQLGASQK